MACRCDMPHTNNANDTLELMRRGDIDGMSFAFNDNPYDKTSVVYERTNERSADGKKEVWLRRVKRAIGLYDVSIVTHPAYGQTSVVTREFADEILREIDEQIEIQKRECGDDEEAKRKAEEEAAAKAEQEKREQEEREAEELERKAREARAVMRMRLNILNLDTEELDF